MSAKNGKPIRAYDREKCADEILRRMVTEPDPEKRSLRAICSDPRMPSVPTFLRWVGEDPALAERYARAREVMVRVMEQELLEIADDGRNDWMEVYDKEGNQVGWRENGEAIRRSALRIDARKWLMSKVLPKVYGNLDAQATVQIDNRTQVVQVPREWLSDPRLRDAALTLTERVIEGEGESEDESA